MNYMDVKAAASEWELTERRITTICRDGSVEGEKKGGSVWIDPETAEEPIDGRQTKLATADKTKT